MANRHNHYEAAFEDFLRARRVPYVAVDEGRRSLWNSPEFGGDGSLKNLDFIVASSQGVRWLIDVKGRRFPAGRRRQFWKNWSTQDDLVSLARWQELFGAGFQSLFVFAYNISDDVAPLPADELFAWREQLYAFVAIRLQDYAGHARTISPRWKTVAIPPAQFRQVARSVVEFL